MSAGAYKPVQYVTCKAIRYYKGANSNNHCGAYWDDTSLYERELTFYQKNLKNECILSTDCLRGKWPQCVPIVWVQSAQIAWHNANYLYRIAFGEYCPRRLTKLEHFNLLFSGKLHSPQKLANSKYKNNQVKTCEYQLRFNHLIHRTNDSTCAKTFNKIATG